MIKNQSRRRVLSALVLGLGGIAASRLARAAPELKADRIVILKSRRRLTLMRGGTALKSFRVALGEHPIGIKDREGDGRTPEGFYIIDARTTHTPYHLSLHLSYPNEVDRIAAEEAHVDPGGAICIHGMPEEFGHADPIGYFKDWTDGCVAVGNIAIERIWAAVDVGTPVQIRA